jgi:hypothetical protein
MVYICHLEVPSPRQSDQPSQPFYGLLSLTSFFISLRITEAINHFPPPKRQLSFPYFFLSRLFSIVCF